MVGDLAVYQDDAEKAKKQGGSDFDDLLALEDSCDLRKTNESSQGPEPSGDATPTSKGKQQTSFQKVWSREVTQYTKVSKSKDILPVLRDLVASLE